MLAEVSQGMEGILGLFGKHNQKYRISPNSLVRGWGKKKSQNGKTFGVWKIGKILQKFKWITYKAIKNQLYFYFLFF
jgi:hypothetical protein